MANENELLPATLIQQAITSNASVEVLERLMALQERWEQSRAKKAFDAAMADLRTDLPPIVKNRTVDYRSAKGPTYYKYEDLHEVTEALSPVMAKHGLAFRWRTASNAADSVSVTCIVSHRDGHFEETTLTAANDHSGSKNDIQALGSAVTYLQRYTLKAALGVAAGTDDDDGIKAGEVRSTHPDRVKYEDQSPKSDGEIANPIMGKIENIERKTGTNKKNGKPWTRYGITIDGVIFGTFDKNTAEFADRMRLQQKTVDLSWTQQGDFRNVESVIEIPDDDNFPEYEPGSKG